MSTRATIKFAYDDEEYYVYRHCDGYPDWIFSDFRKVKSAAKRRWSEPELGMFVTFFLGYLFDKNKTLPDYEITPCFHGDESYRYYVTFNNGEWQIDEYTATNMEDEDVQ